MVANSTEGLDPLLPTQTHNSNPFKTVLHLLISIVTQVYSNPIHKSDTLHPYSISQHPNRLDLFLKLISHLSSSVVTHEPIVHLALCEV